MTSSAGTSVPIPADHRASETYADWARTQGPGVEADARALLERVGRKKATAWGKPGRFVDEAERMVRDLPGAHLPWFWDTIGHWLLRLHRRSAARAYAKARTAERTHDLPADPD